MTETVGGEALVVHRGGCHCGRVRFEVEAPAALTVLDCNCSICRMTGFLHLIVPARQFRLLSGADDLQDYRFNTGAARHRFCRVCGIKAFYIPRSHPDGVDVNARCLDAGTVASLHIVPFDDNDREAATAAIAHLSRAPAASGPGAIRVVDFAPRWRDDFARLNLDWLERLFVVEPVDREVLRDPEGRLLAGGGHVLFAVDGDDHAVGTVALLHHGDGLFEMTKMAVEPALQGQGIGRALVLAALQAFRRCGGRELFLESSSKLLPALHLYAQMGFVHRPAPRPGSHYRRADVYMVWRDPADAEVPAPGDRA